MKTCPNCGNELHDDSTFCFACMTAVNERKDIQIKLNSPYKKAIPVACIAVAVIAASSVFVVVSRKNNAVETKTPEPAKAVTTTSAVTTIPQTTPITTTTIPTTITAPPAPTADEIIKIAGGLRQASTGTAGTTTTTSQPEEPEETQPEENDVQQEENTDNTEPEPSYFSEDGANELSRIMVDKINQERANRGYSQLRVCGQLDELMYQCVKSTKYENEYVGDVTTEYLENHSTDVGLPSDCRFVRALRLYDDSDPSAWNSYDAAYKGASDPENFIHAHFSDDEGDLTFLSQRLNYTYLGVVIHRETIMGDNSQIIVMPYYVCEIWLMK